MKKKLLAFFSIIVLFSLSSCTFINSDLIKPDNGGNNSDVGGNGDNNETNKVTLESISVTDKNYEFLQNETPNTSGIEVVAKYSDGTTKIVSTDAKFTTDTSVLGVVKWRAEYLGATVDFDVNISEVKRALSIKIGDDAKLKYETGDSFVTLNDLDISIILSDNTVADASAMTLTVYKDGYVVNRFTETGKYTCEIVALANNQIVVDKVEIEFVKTSDDLSGDVPPYNPSNDNPSGGNTNPQPSGGNTTPQPSGGSTDPTPSGGNTDPTPSGGNTNPQPSGGSTDSTPSGGEDSTPTTPDDSMDDNTVPGIDLDKVNDDSVINGNSFEIAISEYIANAPEGTVLAAFEVVDKDGNQVNVTEYTEDLASLYVTNLDVNSKYTVYVYYKNKPAEETVSMSLTRTYTTSNGVISESNGLEYPYKFVGIRIVTTSKVTRQVKYMYNGELLYTYYVGYGESLSPYYKFPLPNKYSADYDLIGTTDDVTCIKKDIVVQAILARKDKTTHTVIYLTREGTYLSVQEIEDGQDAVEPTFSDTYDKDNYRYTFSGWSSNGKGVTSDITISPKYSSQIINPIPDVSLYSVSYEDGVLKLSFKDANKGSISGSKIKLTDPSGNEYEKEGYYAYVEVPYGKTYNYVFEYSYTLSGQKYSDSITGSVTIPVLDKLNNAVTISKITFNGYYVRTNGIAKIQTCNDKKSWSSKSLNSGNTTYIINHAYIGQTNYLRYVAKNSYGGYFTYDEIVEINTPDHAEPTFTYTRTHYANYDTFVINGADVFPMSYGAYSYWDVPELNSSYYSTYAETMYMNGNNNSVRYTIYAPKVGSSYYASTYIKSTFSIRYNDGTYVFDVSGTSGTLTIEKEYLVDSYQSKTEFVNEQMTADDIYVTYGWSGVRQRVASTDYTYKLTYSGAEVTSFTSIGTYDVEVFKGSDSIGSYSVVYMTKPGMIFPNLVEMDYNTRATHFLLPFYALTGSQSYEYLNSDYMPTKVYLYDSSYNKIKEVLASPGNTGVGGLNPSTVYYFTVQYENVHDSTDSYVTNYYKITTKEADDYYLVQYKCEGQIINSDSEYRSASITSIKYNYYLNNSISYFFPGYKAIGYMEISNQIYDDTVVEVAIYNPDDTTNIPVVYMNGNNTIFKIDVCHTIGKVVKPAYTIPDKVFGSYKYEFEGWKEESYTIEGITYIYCNYKTTYISS